MVVGYAPSDTPTAHAAIAHAAGAVDPVELESHTRVLTLGAHASVSGALAHLRHTRGVAWAVPDYVAHAAVMPGSHAPAAPTAAGGSRGIAHRGPRAPADAIRAARRPPPRPASPSPTTPVWPTRPGGGTSCSGTSPANTGCKRPAPGSNLIADHAPGGRGVIVAVLDTGVAYANRGRFRMSPDFYHYQFVAG